MAEALPSGSVFDYSNNLSETRVTQTKLNLILISVNRHLPRLLLAMTNKKIIPNLVSVGRYGFQWRQAYFLPDKILQLGQHSRIFGQERFRIFTSLT
jgi:hypothetical protein